MLKVKPFRAVRPRPEIASKVAALPYDVMNSDEAREMVKDEPLSFLRIDRAEINLPEGIDPYEEQVYSKAKEVYEERKEDGTFIQDEKPCYYIWKLTLKGQSQCGIVCCPSSEDYRNGLIKKHEHTTVAKEQDRIRHVDALDANTGPIFLSYKDSAELENIIDKYMQEDRADGNDKKIYDFTGPGGVRHEAWIVDTPDVIQSLEKAFAELDALYIADGHHRCASAAKVSDKRKAADPNPSLDKEYDRFLAVVFPESQLKILDYNRVVKDLNGLSHEEFFKKLEADFDCSLSESPVNPQASHEFGMFIKSDSACNEGNNTIVCAEDNNTTESAEDKNSGYSWYRLNFKGDLPEGDPVAGLDVSVLQDRLLSPILGIEDPRTDKRIDFVGGIRGLDELERRVKGGMAVAFSLYPTQMKELIAVADAGKVMPPKSTWFEPKLLSGLFIHELK